MHKFLGPVTKTNKSAKEAKALWDEGNPHPISEASLLPLPWGTIPQFVSLHFATSLFQTFLQCVCNIISHLIRSHRGRCPEFFHTVFRWFLWKLSDHAAHLAFQSLQHFSEVPQQFFFFFRWNLLVIAHPEMFATHDFSRQTKVKFSSETWECR